MKLVLTTFSLLSLWAVSSSVTLADEPETVVQEAISILTTQQASSSPIPSSAFHDAKAVGIVKVEQGGLVIGGSGGVGVLLAHEGHKWSSPFFFHIGSHSIGFQAGVGVKDYVFVVNSDNAVKLFSNDEKKDFQAIGHYIAAQDHGAYIADGPDRPQELVVYTSARGAYAGATLGDTLVGASPELNTAVYDTQDYTQILSDKVKNPTYAEPLQSLLRKYSNFDPKDAKRLEK